MKLEEDSSRSGSPPQGPQATALDRAIGATVNYVVSIFTRTSIPPATAGLIREKDAARAAEELEPRPGGYWLGELEADTTLESDYILFLYFLDPQRHREKIRKLANYLRQHQLDDGSWNIYHGGPGDVSASVKAYFALKLAGWSTDETFMVRAREVILRMGGAEKVNTFTKIYLSFLNQVDWKEIPAIPPEIVLLPRFFYFNIYEVSYWSRAILIPLSILYAKKPNRPVTEDFNIRELFAKHALASATNGKQANGKRANGDLDAPGRGAHRPASAGAHSNGNGASQGNGALLARRLDQADPLVAAPGGANGNGGPRPSQEQDRKDPNLLSWRNFFLLIDRLLKLIEKAPIKPLRNLALKRAEEWMVSRTEDSDGLGAIFPAMVNSVLAMRSLGHDESHPAVASTLEKLRALEIEEGDTLRLQPCLSPVWDSALAVNALREAGVPHDAPEIVEAGRWLVSKEVRKSGDWQMRLPGVEVSGWYFQFQNEFYPDIDDTAAVLLALDRVDPGSVEGLEAAIGRGINWVVSMQCSNGGWAAFDVDMHREALTHVPYADHNAMLDPGCADITGRVLEMFGRFPYLRNEPSIEEVVQRGIKFLKSEQKEDGSWYGRWGVNYIYGTWQALKGLLAVGEDTQASCVRRAVSWLKGCQNADGGWGETCESYKNAAVKGLGPSTASQTAWAIMGLAAADGVDSPEVERGVKYLLETQEADGTWHEDAFTGTGFPDVFYLKYHLYRVYFPLFALGYYRNLKAGRESPRGQARITLPPARRGPAGVLEKGKRRGLLGFLT